MLEGTEKVNDGNGGTGITSEVVERVGEGAGTEALTLEAIGGIEGSAVGVSAMEVSKVRPCPLAPLRSPRARTEAPIHMVIIAGPRCAISGSKRL
jgi:hypothetical protein